MSIDDTFVRLERLKPIYAAFCTSCGANAVTGTRLCKTCIAKALKDYVAECGESGLAPTNLYAIVGTDRESHTRYGVKFGLALDPEARLKALQTGSALDLSLYGYVPCVSLLERNIHAKLRRHRIRGEWFAACHKVYEVMSMIRNKQADKLYDLCGLAKIREMLASQ